MAWEDDRDFVDDYVDGLTDGISSGIVAPTMKTVSTTPAAAPSTLVKSAALASMGSGSIANVLKPAPSSTPTPPTSSVVLHTPLTTIASPVQKVLGPAASSGSAQAFQDLATKVGGADIVLSTPGVSSNVETLPVATDLDSRLRAIRGALLAIRAQSEASSEHRSLMKRDDFRRNVIARLSRIESRLPQGSRAAEQIRTIRVLL